MPNATAHLARLAEYAHPEGGWGYRPDLPPHLEPTCLALLALATAKDAYAEQIEKGVAFLESCRCPDGSFRWEKARREAVWPTAMALYALAEVGHDPSGLQRTASRLLGIRGRPLTEEDAKSPHDIDVSLIGWPWCEGNFSWAEPTAWACLALRSVGQRHHPRVQEGIRLLLDRTADEGGINYGNRRVLGRKTEPIPTPTALMLIACQRLSGESEYELEPIHVARLEASVQYLIQAVLGCGDVEHLAWARLALALFSDQPNVAAALDSIDVQLAEAWEARDGKEWLSPSPVRTALTAMALMSKEHHPFDLGRSRAGASRILEPTEASPPRPSFVERIRIKLQTLAAQAVGNLRTYPEKSRVHIGRCEDYNGDLLRLLRDQFDGFRDQVPLKGRRVVLKPNLVEYHREKVINTHPHVVAAAIELCLREGAAEVIVAEGPGHWRNVEYLVAESGLGDVLRHYRVPFVDLNHDLPVKMPNLGGLTGMPYLYLSRTVADAEVLISLPKLKTHHWAGATLSLKNLFGTLPGTCYGWPKNELHWRGIDRSIVDIALTRTPDLAIVDGIIGMEGDGPLNGTPKPVGAIVMGTDLVAVDATCCRLMQLDPQQIGYLVMANAKKLGRLQAAEVEQLGETIESLAQPFETIESFAHLRQAQVA